ncbi:MAG: hypothetical protein HGB03_01340 [Candidatus Yonathbacteria bacterium]|nr:hypothetical protein [Candidatus Yonathbacteria bacterium]
MSICQLTKRNKPRYYREMTDTQQKGQFSHMSAPARMWVLLIIGILIGWGGYYLWVNRDIESGRHGNRPKTEEVLTDEMKETETPTMPEGISATVGEQPEGMHVFLNAVSTDRTIWVAVRELHNGGLWNILGASRLDAGVYDGVWVELLRNTFGGQTYAIVIYEDDGDKVFDHTKDIMLPGTNGDGIVATFGVIRI